MIFSAEGEEGRQTMFALSSIGSVMLRTQSRTNTHLADVLCKPSLIPQLSLRLLLQLKKSSKTDSAIQEGTAMMHRGIPPPARCACWARSPTRCSPWRSWPPPPPGAAAAASSPGGRGWSRRRATASGERGRLQSAIHLS